MMTQQLLTIASASIPITLLAWFVVAIANKIFTRCQMARQQPQLVQVKRAIATDAPSYLESLPALPSVTSEVVTPETAPTPYETMTLAELRKLARRRGVSAIGDSRKRQSWLDALVAHQ